MLAPNPSPMTQAGTNTYLLGGDDGLAVIDPGPDDSVHLDLVMRTIGRARVSHILVTHSHLDHSAMAPRLADRTGAPVLAFGSPEMGRSPRMAQLATTMPLGGGEGADTTFRWDRRLEDGAIVEGAEWTLRVLWTPGHYGNHLCFAWNDRIFTGDLVMGWATSIVSPPDGDMAQYLASCERLARQSASVLFPGHGDPVTDPADRIAWLIAHRKAREAQVLKHLRGGPADAETLARAIYTDTPAALIPAATRNVLAHLLDLHERGRVAADPHPGPTASFALR
ncbi:metallo-beta-lactamase family protein [Oceaniovalibus guishaninsula JLT2003]|uniref:Metallo-beta-lactamase family protein n=2 Tax=Oceaniovalibus TaxID=1207070 RepID=K2HRA4_9RHOB|nr:metallo-beta-lactamase family protein [Oceaniovalibus guishaninsula JLT2003]